MTATFPVAETGAFDAVAASYEAALERGLCLAGEGPEYFAERRIAWTARVLEGAPVRRVLDFGCGVGLAAPMLANQFAASEAWGFDPSTASIERAKQDRPEPQFRWTADAAELPRDACDLVYC
ncbi:MAG TPA: methyltransferase domain-containing protein, partial [Lacipirellulaceae bacterium]|nr:methyltransferase domain-containing protein [Lacipirellulaceae bacterium]